VQALSEADVLAIQSAIDALNPFDSALVPHLLKIEARGQWLGITSGRHVLYREDAQGQVHIVKGLAGGVGKLLDPTKPSPAEQPVDDDNHAQPPAWTDAFWRVLIEGQRNPSASVSESWLDQLAVEAFPIRSLDQARQLRRAGFNVKPGGFLLKLRLDRHDHGTNHPAVIAPYDDRPEHWPSLDWRRADTAKRVRLVLDNDRLVAPGEVRPVTIRRFLSEFRRAHPAGMLDQAGELCHPGTIGLLRPAPVVGTGHQPCGHGGRRLRSVAPPKPKREPKPAVQRATLPESAGELLRRCPDLRVRLGRAGLTTPTKGPLSRWLAGKAAAPAEVLTVAYAFATEVLTRRNLSLPNGEARLWAAVEALRQRWCAGCDAPLPVEAKGAYCAATYNACRVRAQRRPAA
jgi:hypothetical protein